MNPELERRLRRFGATVDATAEAAETARRAAARPRAAGHLVEVSDLDPIAPARRPPSAFRIFAAAAAIAAVAVGGVIMLSRVTSSPDIATGQVNSTAEAVVDSTEPATTVADPLRTQPSATASTTSTSATTVATTNPPVCPTYRANETLPLRLCDQGEKVRLVQQRLNETVAAGLGVDGHFGPGTGDAVREFQRESGLEVDGLVGPATWAALFPESATTTQPVVTS